MNSVRKEKIKYTGFTFPYKEKRLTIKELAEKAKCSTSMVHKFVKDLNEKPEAFVARIRKKRLNQAKNDIELLEVQQIKSIQYSQEWHRLRRMIETKQKEINKFDKTVETPVSRLNEKGEATSQQK